MQGVVLTTTRPAACAHDVRPRWPRRRPRRYTGYFFAKLAAGAGQPVVLQVELADWVSGPAPQPLASARVTVASPEWAMYNFSIFAPSSSWEAHGEFNGTASSLAFGFLPLLERMGNCLFVLVVVSFVRLLLRAIISRKLPWIVFVSMKSVSKQGLRHVEPSSHQKHSASLQSVLEVSTLPNPLNV